MNHSLFVHKRVKTVDRPQLNTTSKIYTTY